MPSEGAYPATRSFSHLDSVQLLREFERTGNSAPFEELVRRHTPAVYATCLRVTRDAHDAEDATQATFLTLAAKGKLNGEIHAPEAWLRKVGHRLALDLIRSKKRRSNRETLRSKMTSEIRPIDSSQKADNSETKSILHEELAKLPSGYRMPLILHYFGGLSREEMSDQLRIKPSTLGVRLHRAREQLRKRMARRGVNMPLAALSIFLGEAVRQRIADSIVAQCGSSIASISTSNGIGLGSISAMQSSLISSSLIASSVRDVMASIATSKVKIGALTLMAMLSFGINAPSLAQLIPEKLVERIKQIRLRDFFENLEPKLPKSIQVDVPRLVVTSEPVVKPIEPIKPTRSVAQSNRAIYVLTPSIKPSAVGDEIRPVVLASIGARPGDDVAPEFSTRLPGPTRLETQSPALTQPSNTAPRSFAAISSSSNSHRSKGNRVAARSAQIVPDRSSSLAVSSFRVGQTRANGRRASDGMNVAGAVIASPGFDLSNETGTELIASGSDGMQTVPSMAVPPKPPTVVIEESNSVASNDQTTSGSYQSASVSSGPHDVAPPNNLTGDSTSQTTGASVTIASNPSQSPVPSEQHQFSISSIDTMSRRAPLARPGVVDEPIESTDGITETVHFRGTPDAFGGYDFASMSASQLAMAAEALRGRSSDTTTRATLAPVNPFDTPSTANAVKLTLHDESAAGSVIDFLETVDVTSLGLPQLPKEHTFFGLWKLDSAGEFASADIEVRYDDILASRLGLDEHWVKLWVSDGSSWDLLMNSPTFGRDTDRNLVWASASDFEYFAVSTPEPATIGVVFGSMLIMLRRRRSI